LMHRFADDGTGYPMLFRDLTLGTHPRTGTHSRAFQLLNQERRQPI
jgi:hypothetical protein